MSEKSALRKEYDRLRFDGTLARECGSACVNCGSEENVEYHHIVPLVLGGTNNLRNIVPLCHRCHKAAHGSHHIQRYVENPNAGRKPKIPDEEAFPIYDRWLDGQFGNRKLRKLLNLKGGTKHNCTAQYKRWCADRGIRSVRNNYDVAMTSSYDKLGERYIVGFVVLSDGTKQHIFFNDLGENDDVEYAFCAGKDRADKRVTTWGEMKEWLAVQNAEKVREIQRKRNRWMVDFENASREFFNETQTEAVKEPEEPEVFTAPDGGIDDSVIVTECVPVCEERHDVHVQRQRPLKSYGPREIPDWFKQYKANLRSARAI